MKKYIVIACLIITTVTYSQTQGKLLEQAYKKKSTELLNQFFINWHNEIPTISNTEFSNLNDTLKQAYNVFTAFYKPCAIDSVGGSEFGNKLYENVDYLIVQNETKIYITSDKLYYTDQEKYDFAVEYYHNWNNLKDSIKNIRLDYLKKIMESDKFKNKGVEIEYMIGRRIPEKIKTTLIDTLKKFRPEINCEGKIPVYLNEEYRNLLNAFLGNTYLPFGTGGIMNPARSKGESLKRQKFLENSIKIFFGHWGGYWQLLSYPQAYSVIFDKNMQYAKVEFRMVYQGGEAFLKNENGSWKMIFSRITWIE